jgi:glycosyltransferase involved in cell wall biosynthesis
VAPRFSVVVPAYDCAALLAQCLDSLQRSDFRDFECVVVDDGSPAPLQAVAAERGVRLLRLETRSGPARARNAGVAATHGEILVFFDADVRVHSETLRRFDEHFRARPRVDAVMGSYDRAPADAGFVSQFKNLFHHYIHHNSRTEAWTFWAGCGAVRRDAFVAAGGFDEARWAIEDIELGLRLRARGHRIDLDPTIQVTHLKRWTLWSMVRTDMFVRAVPWLMLMLRDRTMPADLNVTLSHRLSVGLVWVVAALVVGVASTGSSVGAVLSLAVVATLLFLNRDLYRFFARERGWLFALGSVALHWLYYIYCGLAVGIALILHWRERHALRTTRLTSLGPSP